MRQPGGSSSRRTNLWERGITALVAAMMRSGHWLPLIAIAENPSIAAVVRAIKVGALDYLTVPEQIAPAERGGGPLGP